MRKGLPTVMELVKKTADFFAAEGIASARLDAEVLLADVLGLDRIHLYVNFDRPLEEAEVDRYRQAVIRRAQRVPVAYITGEKEFMSLPFSVNPQVLIPRPETELLVERVVSLLPREFATGGAKVADIGTGSGVIAICLALQSQVEEVWATDISPSALQVARANAARHQVEGKIRWVQGDMLKPLEHLGPDFFDFIVSNPPYVPTAAIGKDCPEVLKEPRKALDGGRDGLAYYRILVDQAPGLLRPGGWLCLEIGADQGPRVQRLMEQSGRFDSPQIIKDLANLDRVVIGRVR